VTATIVYSDEWAGYAYSSQHPLKPIRLQLTYELVQAYDLLRVDGARMIPAAAATMSELSRVHTVEYLNVLQAASAGQEVLDSARYGLGPGDNPIFPGMFRFSALSAGASLQAAQVVDAGAADVAFNMAGGLHHGMPSRASGFCYVNDVVLAIEYLRDRGHRIAYIDIDTHHGDGVQAAYYQMSQVLTISLHESGRYLFPGTGFEDELGEGDGLGYSVNVPFHPHTEDEVFTWAFRQVVLPLLKIFQPNVIVTQLGVDTFRSDPLSDLGLTTRGFCAMIEAFRDLHVPWVALGGGGYDVPNVPRAWTLAWAIMTGIAVPPELPEVYLQSAARHGYPNNTGRSLHDPPPEVDVQGRDAAWREAERVVEYLKAHVFPLVQGRYRSSTRHNEGYPVAADREQTDETSHTE
jgi:acetoin utilization protein AcuC